ncbi:hypothetical protein ACLOJK_012634 [Asimina triloba]
MKIDRANCSAKALTMITITSLPSMDFIFKATKQAEADPASSMTTHRKNSFALYAKILEAKNMKGLFGLAVKSPQGCAFSVKLPFELHATAHFTTFTAKKFWKSRKPSQAFRQKWMVAALLAGETHGQTGPKSKSPVHIADIKAPYSGLATVSVHQVSGAVAKGRKHKD